MAVNNILSLDSKFSIVLGGLGLIGKAVVKELLRADSEVLILDLDKKIFDKFFSMCSNMIISPSSSESC